MGGLKARKIIHRIGPDKGGYWEVSGMVNGILKNGEESHHMAYKYQTNEMDFS